MILIPAIFKAIPFLSRLVASFMTYGGPVTMLSNRLSIPEGRPWPRSWTTRQSGRRSAVPEEATKCHRFGPSNSSCTQSAR